MKICVLGGGTAAAASLLQIQKSLTQHRMLDTELYSIYDPNIPITLIGESSTGMLLNSLNVVLDVNDFCMPYVLDEFDGTLRWYTHYYWKEASGKDFLVKHGTPGIHLNSEKFSKWFMDKLTNTNPNYKTILGNVTNIVQGSQRVVVTVNNEKLEFDYLIDCRGTPSKEDLASGKYNFPEFESVNSAILYPEFKNYKEEFTSGTVHENGWMFEVPLQNRKTFGYLYNNNITSTKDAVTHFSKFKGIDASKCKQVSWQQYYRKNAVDNRILYLGNKLYFFEPIQALPLHYYMVLSSEFIGSIINGETGRMLESKMNAFHSENIEKMKDMVAFNYCGENKIDSPFWNYAKKESAQQLKKSETFVNWCNDVINTGVWEEYGIHHPSIMKTYFDGYNFDLTQFKK